MFRDEALQEACSSIDHTDIYSSIKELRDSSIIQDDLLQKFSQFENASFKNVKTTVLPTYEKSSSPLLKKGKHFSPIC